MHVMCVNHTLFFFFFLLYYMYTTKEHLVEIRFKKTNKKIFFHCTLEFCETYRNVIVLSSRSAIGCASVTLWLWALVVCEILMVWWICLLVLGLQPKTSESDRSISISMVAIFDYNPKESSPNLDVEVPFFFFFFLLNNTSVIWRSFRAFFLFLC